MFFITLRRQKLREYAGFLTLDSPSTQQFLKKKTDLPK